MDDKKSRMADIVLQSAGAKMAVAAFVIGLVVLPFLPSSPSPDRYPGANEFPLSLVDGGQTAAGLPRPASDRHAPAVSALPPEHPDRKLLDAIRIKEGYRGDREVGPRGERGPYQIRKAYWTDACDYAHIDWNSDEWWYETHVYDPDKCEFIFWLYMLRHLGPDADDHAKARCHNGGPPEGQDIRAWDYARDVMCLMAMGGE